MAISRIDERTRDIESGNTADFPPLEKWHERLLLLVRVAGRDGPRLAVDSGRQEVIPLWSVPR